MQQCVLSNSAHQSACTLHTVDHCAPPTPHTPDPPVDSRLPSHSPTCRPIPNNIPTSNTTTLPDRPRFNAIMPGITRRNQTIRKSTPTACTPKYKTCLWLYAIKCARLKNATRKPTSIKCSKIKQMLETECGQNIEATFQS